jgi:hypothetical protein
MVTVAERRSSQDSPCPCYQLKALSEHYFERPHCRHGMMMKESSWETYPYFSLLTAYLTDGFVADSTLDSEYNFNVRTDCMLKPSTPKLL